MISFTSQNLEIILVGLFLLFFIWNIILEIKLRKERERINIFFKGRKAEDLEGVISEILRVQRNSEKSLNEILNRIEKLDKIALSSIQKAGVIRFNPFEEIGGNQSFSLALLDQKDDGVVISAYHSKEGTRVYAKPIKQGESTFSLSKEEEEVIRKAIQK